MEIYRDPLCDRPVNPMATTPKSDHQGKTYYFCCELCKQLFEREPQKYAVEQDEKGEQTYKEKP